jgi:hypothetical protein
MISFLIKKLDRYRQHAISSSIDDLTILLIVGSLSESRLKSVRFLVGKSGADVTSTADRQIIKINHQLNLSSSSSLKIITYLTEIDSYNSSDKYYSRLHHL